jgi:molecular chaperone DnaK
MLKDFGDKVPAAIKSQVQDSLEAVRKVKDSEDEPAIRKAVEALSQAVQKIGAAAYQQPGAAQPGPEPAGGQGPKPTGEGDVIDG